MEVNPLGVIKVMVVISNKMSIIIFLDANYIKKTAGMVKLAKRKIAGTIIPKED